MDRSLRQDEKDALEQRVKAMQPEEIQHMLKFVDPILLMNTLYAYVNDAKFLRKSMDDLFKMSQRIEGGSTNG